MAFSDHDYIIQKMPYGSDFHFVDRYEYLHEDGACGYYRYQETETFYESHFPGHPITPGVILTETMAQIGLVGLGIFLLEKRTLTAKAQLGLLLTESQVQFLKKVLPGEEVKVISEKVYFRLGKLKCNVTMYNEAGEKVCYGTMAGMLTSEAIKNG